MSASKPDVSRRTFLRAATLGVASAAVPLGSLEGAAAAQSPASASASMTRSSFAPHLHRSFRMTADGHTARVSLVEVSDLVGATTRGDEHRFSLLFRAAPHHRAEHGIHRFSRAGFGSMDLFVVPVGRGVDARHYQAVVTRYT